MRGRRNADLSDTARAVFYFRRDVKTTSEYYLYSVLSMLAEIGGYVGLLMGVSLFKLAEINNLCIDYYATRKELDKEEEEGRFSGRTRSFSIVRNGPSYSTFHM